MQFAYVHDVVAACMAAMAEHGAIAPDDLRLILVTDDLDEAMAHLETHTVEPFGLRRQRPRRWLGERGITFWGGSRTRSASAKPDR